MGSQLSEHFETHKCNSSLVSLYVYMWCLSTADPNYINAALILTIQGIVLLN